MGEIERVNGQLVGGISLNSAESTKSISWDSGENWHWHNINELPDYIISEFIEDYLFPNQVYFSIVKMPERATVNGVPSKTEIDGWIAGDNCFTHFKLSKNLKDSDDKYKLVAKRIDFKEPVDMFTKSEPADSEEQKENQAQELKKSKGVHPLQDGKYLPQAFQRLLATVPNPEYLNTYIYQSCNEEKGEIRQVVVATAYNQVHCISIKATREFSGKPSSSEKKLVENLEKSDWTGDIVRGFFK